MPAAPFQLLPESELTPAASSKPLMYEIEDKNKLYTLYMPFLKTGGIFVPTNQNIPVGSKIALILKLFNTRKPITGKSIWITPPQAAAGLQQGIGVAFDDNEANRLVKVEIENALAGMLRSEVRTQTF